jgi:DNA-binding MarR family transcriptional regulator
MATAPQVALARDVEPEGPKVNGLNEIVGFHLRLANVAVFRHFMASLSHLDLTQKQLSALWLIGDNPGVAQIDLAAWLDMDRATMMAIIDRLEARGLVVRSKSKSDRRRQDLNLTEEGDKLLHQHALPAVRLHEEWLKQRIGDNAKVREFVATLRLIYA